MKQILKCSLKLFLMLLFAQFASFVIAVSFAVIFAKLNQALFYAFTQIFNIIILVTLIANSLYTIGFKDSNMVRTGHLKEDMYKGFKIGTIAQMPFLLLFISSVFVNIRFSIYRIFNSAYFWFLTAIAGNSEYMRMGFAKITAMVLLLLIVPIISGVIYILGYKGIDIFSKTIYKKDEGNK